jgi:hypothetical protein
MTFKQALLADVTEHTISFTDGVKILIGQGIMMGLIFSTLVIIPAVLGYIALKLIEGIS